MEALSFPHPSERPDLWPWALCAPEGEDRSDILKWTISGQSLQSICTQEEITRAVIFDEQDMCGHMNVWATALFEEFWDGYGMSGAFAFYSGWGTKEPRVLSAIASCGIAAEYGTRHEIEDALAAGVKPPLLRIRLNAQTADFLRERSELRHCTVLCDTVGFHYLSPQMPQRVALDVRHVKAEELANVLCALSHEDLDRFAGLCVTVPNSNSHTREETERALEHILDALLSLKGEYLLLSEGNEAPEAAPIGATQTARTLADLMRKLCGERGMSVPTLDYEPSPSILAHSGIVIDTLAGTAQPLAGDFAPVLTPIWR